MLKVHIIDRVLYCDGKAYLPEGDATDWKGETYTRYAPCHMCEGTSERGKWIAKGQPQVDGPESHIRKECAVVSAYDYSKI